MDFPSFTDSDDSIIGEDHYAPFSPPDEQINNQHGSQSGIDNRLMEYLSSVSSVPFSRNSRKVSYLPCK